MRERTPPSTDQDDSEYELTLGNKQLLSILFLVVVLFGVFFAMGYVMGRNSAPVDAAAGRSDSDPSVVPSTVRQSAGGKANEAEVVIEPEPPQEDKTDNSPREAASEINTPDIGSTAGGPPLVIEPQPGQKFLQVSAVAKPEAELLVEVLTRKDFKALIAPGPNDRLFRVLVGPIRDDDESVKVRGELEAAGFKPIPRQY